MINNAYHASANNMLMARFTGVFWKCARIGERLSPYVMEGEVTNNNAVLTVKHAIHRRKPPRLSNRKNDIYVTEKTHIKDTGYKAVYIHAMGEAMNRAISLALQLKRQGRGSLNIDVCTSSVNLIDDLEPVVDDAKVEKRTRTTSAIHIKLFKCEVAVDDY
ncbi:Ribonuclease P protein subunit p20 [Trichinella papuae]|uniref:Ribonuclease P protein subunit p20 n=1 Tax=Trichinella papuae TaxID=268474 RepID=A0A0V1N845_9BILA|nr:Ribonuclease P protein subunit p20 [Trichinella papuae]